MITVTDAAIRHVRTLVADNPEYRHKGLRVFVETGGCAGMQYGIQFDEAKDGDQRVKEDGVEVLIDAQSAPILDGSTIDFVDGLTDAGFKITNPNAIRSCGCGSSFEISRDS
jgi:iron-sulfur cluster assembly accessory protein